MLRPSVNQYDVSAMLVSLPCSFMGCFKDSTWCPTGDEQLDWFVPCDYIFLVHARSQHRNCDVIAIVRKTKPSHPYDYDHDTLTTMHMIFDSHRVLVLLTTMITIAITITLLVHHCWCELALTSLFSL